MKKVRCFCALCGLGLLFLAGCRARTEEPFAKVPTETPTSVLTEKPANTPTETPMKLPTATPVPTEKPVNVLTGAPIASPAITGTAERLPEGKRISVAVGYNYAAYLDEEGELHILYAPEEIRESVDLEKKYIALGTDLSTLVTIDEEGKLWAYFHSTAEEIEDGIRQAIEEAAKYGGNVGYGFPSPDMIRSFAELSGVRQVVSDYPSECTILLEDGTMFTQSHLSGDARLLWEGVTLKEVAVPIAGAAAGITEDGTFVFMPTGWEREKKLKEWPAKLKQICAGNGLVGLTEDGMVIAEESELNYIINTVEKWSDIRSVAAQGGTVVGLKEDGTVVAVCTLGNDKGQCAVTEWSDIAAVGTNGKVTIGVRKDGSIVMTEEKKR